MLEELKKSLVECPVVKKGDYFYFVHPISDGVPLVESKLMNSIMDYIVDNFVKIVVVNVGFYCGFRIEN